MTLPMCFHLHPGHYLTLLLHSYLAIAVAVVVGGIAICVRMKNYAIQQQGMLMKNIVKI